MMDQKEWKEIDLGLEVLVVKQGIDWRERKVTAFVLEDPKGWGDKMHEGLKS